MAYHKLDDFRRKGFFPISPIMAIVRMVCGVFCATTGATSLSASSSMTWIKPTPITMLSIGWTGRNYVGYQIDFDRGAREVAGQHRESFAPFSP
jgi:hypothetical protein